MSRGSFLNRKRFAQVGEGLIYHLLVSNHYTVYQHDNSQHPIDMIAFDRNNHPLAVEVKIRSRLNKYNGFGISLRHYKTYLNFQHKTNISVVIFFINYDEGVVYGNYLNELAKPTVEFTNNGVIEYPVKTARFIIFSCENMREVARISDILTDNVKNLGLGV